MDDVDDDLGDASVTFNDEEDRQYLEGEGEFIYVTSQPIGMLTYVNLSTFLYRGQAETYESERLEGSASDEAYP